MLAFYYSLTSPTGQFASILFGAAVLHENKDKIKNIFSSIQQDREVPKFSRWQSAKIWLAASLVMQSFGYKTLHAPFALFFAPLAYSSLKREGAFSNLKKLAQPGSVTASIAISNYVLGKLPLSPLFFTALSLMKMATSFFKINNTE